LCTCDSQPFFTGRHVYRVRLALGVMRRFPKETHPEERSAELNRLLLAGALTQVAINNAGLCDGGKHC
jgi:hypothetical protein